MERKVDARVMSRDNFFTRAMAVRYKIKPEDDDNMIADKIAGRWIDPDNKDDLNFDENDYIEF